MIDIDLSDPAILALHPHGALSESDFETLTQAVDCHINETDRVPNLVISLDRLPHWDSLGAMLRHFQFVRLHQKVIAKLAIVGDVPLLSIAPEIANHFVKAEVRRFPAAKLEEARAWAGDTVDDPGRFEVIEGLPEDVIALRAVGIITAEDYRDTLIPLVAAKQKRHDKLKCLIVLDEDYATYSGDAVWSDTKFGLTHATTFSRIALVTDILWMKRTARLFMALMHFAFEAFPLSDLEKAKD